MDYLAAASIERCPKGTAYGTIGKHTDYDTAGTISEGICFSLIIDTSLPIL